MTAFFMMHTALELFWVFIGNLNAMPDDANENAMLFRRELSKWETLKKIFFAQKLKKKLRRRPLLRPTAYTFKCHKNRSSRFGGIW